MSKVAVGVWALVIGMVGGLVQSVGVLAGAVCLALWGSGSIVCS